MKKITQNLLFALAGTLFLFSCGEDDEPVAVDIPSVNVTASVDGTAISSGDEVVVGSEVSFNVSITAPGGVNGLDLNGTSYSRTQLGAEAGDTQANITITSTLGETALGNTVSFEFEAVDDAGQVSTTVTFTIDVVSPAVNSYTQVLIGGFLNSTLGSFYNAVENIVYTSNDATTNAASVDLLFYYADTPGYTIAALDNAEAEATISSQTGGTLANFDPQNPTRFKTFLTAPDFDAVSTVAELQNAYAGDAASSDESRVTGLAQGNIFGFVLATARGEKVGIIRVTETTGTQGSDRAIEIEVKIEP
ncbi:MAG: hypothetical protein AAF391_09545 [Bacteroidota bacterium]